MLTAAEKEMDSVHRSHRNATVSALSSKPFVFPVYFLLNIFKYPANITRAATAAR